MTGRRKSWQENSRLEIYRASRRKFDRLGIVCILTVQSTSKITFLTWHCSCWRIFDILWLRDANILFSLNCYVYLKLVLGSAQNDVLRPVMAFCVRHRRRSRARKHRYIKITYRLPDWGRDLHKPYKTFIYLIRRWTIIFYLFFIQSAFYRVVC